ncbi:MAG: type IV pilus assembly protein FimV, partial [Pseudomonadota bacterium]
MAPAAALALGLGEVKLHSALNQRLDANIELLSVAANEADDIEVSLASAEAFSRVGLERPAVLRFMEFDVQQGEDGRYFIKASSQEIIREPYLDFLIEVRWPNGRMLREYTLLLDPPVSHREDAPAITTPDSGESRSSESTASEEPDSPPPAPAATQTDTTPRQPAAAAPQEGVSYGPVKSSDTLWAIARQLRPNQ